MTFNPNLHHRRSIRLQGYDYSQAGAYFITICTHDRVPLFGEIVDGVMMLNAAGNIVNEEWNKTGQIRHQIALHEFVIMPNHIHGIIQLVGARATRPYGAVADINHSTRPYGAACINHSTHPHGGGCGAGV